MTCLYLDSCAAYPSSTDALTAGWTTAGTGYQAAGGRFGTGALRVSQTLGLARTAAIGTGGTIGHVIRFPTTIPAITSGIIRVLEGATLHIDVRTNALQQLTITRNGTLLATGNTALTAGIEYVVQFKFTIHDTTGSLELWVNDTQETLTFVTGTSTTQDTRNGGTGLIDNFTMGGGGGTAFTADISEIYINNNVGSAPNNGIWGSYRIQAKRMSAAGASAQWTPLASTNVSQVDEPQGNDGDTTYNSSSTAGHIDLFQTTQITPTGGTVPAIMHRLVARKDDAGVRTIRPKLRQASTNHSFASQNITTAYAHYTEVSATNPQTAAAYTVAEMRSSTTEFGYELVA